MTIPECDVRMMQVDLVITHGRVHRLIRGRELAATHTLEKIRRARMLEKQAAWKGESGFGRIETISEMHAEILRRMFAGFAPEYFYTGLHNPRRPPTPKNLPWI